MSFPSLTPAPAPALALAAAAAPAADKTNPLKRKDVDRALWAAVNDAKKLKTMLKESWAKIDRLSKEQKKLSEPKLYENVESFLEYMYARGGAMLPTLHADLKIFKEKHDIVSEYELRLAFKHRDGTPGFEPWCKVQGISSIGTKLLCEHYTTLTLSDRKRQLMKELDIPTSSA